MVESRCFNFGVNQKNAKVDHKWRGLRHVVYFYDFGTLYISWTGEPRDFKIGMQIDRQAYKPKYAKVVQ